MVQELIDLRNSILEKRYQDALSIVDELELMGKQSILNNIESFLIRLLIHLIKNQVEQRLTNSWAASIADSLRQIQKLNLKGNKKSYYIKQSDWEDYLFTALQIALLKASGEIEEGNYSPKQLQEKINESALIQLAQNFLNLTYIYQNRELITSVQQELTKLPGGDIWNA